jgi:hypothetical protein
MVDARDERGCQRSEADAEVVEVGGVEWSSEELVDERHEVVKRRDARERRCSDGPEVASCNGEQKRGLDSGERDLVGAEGSREAAIGEAHAP